MLIKNCSGNFSGCFSSRFFRNKYFLSNVNNPKRAGDLERIVLEQKKVSACPPNQIMDFLILGQFKNFPKISFGPNSACGSVDTATIGMTHPTLFSKLSKVDTTSDPSGIKYEPRDTVKMISYLSSVYRIGKWDTHLGLATWDGSSIRTEIYPDTYEGTMFESYL